MDFFVHGPVPHWLVDFSGCRPLLEGYRAEGFDAIVALLERDEALAKRCRDAVMIVDANRAAVELFGLEADVLRGRVVRFIPEQHYSSLAAEIAAVATGRMPFRHDVSTASPAAPGTLDLILSMADPDDWSRVLVATIDVTRRVMAMNALRESEERFRTLCENAPVMIDQFDEQGKCVLWNRECERRLGWTQAEIASHDDPLSMAYPDPRDRDRVLESIRRADGEFREYRVCAKSGEFRAQLWADFRLPSGALISVGHDITELREAEASQRKLEEQMWQTQKLESLGVLAGGIAHDFNNLLVGVLANADLARDATDPAERGQLLDGIIAAARRAADLSNQMLEYSGKGTLNRERIDLTSLVRDLAPMVAAVAAKTSRIRYEVEPESAVEGDVTQLRQVVFNLILNGSEALEDRPGTVAVGVRREERDAIRSVVGEETLPAGRYVCLEVADDGVGMDAETAARVFDPFFTTKFAGRGLGLASVLGIVRGHGGALELDTAPGEGTTFRVYLPESHRRAAAAEAEPEPPMEQEIPPCVVLLVDDEPMVRHTMKILLRSEGHETLAAADGEEALRIFGEERERIDMAIIDATMPRMSGGALIEALREKAPALPIILVSGYSEPLATGRLAGTVGFLQKPYSLAQLKTAMAEALR